MAINHGRHADATFPFLHTGPSSTSVDLSRAASRTSSPRAGSSSAPVVAESRGVSRSSRPTSRRGLAPPSKSRVWRGPAGSGRVSCAVKGDALVFVGGCALDGELHSVECAMFLYSRGGCGRGPAGCALDQMFPFAMLGVW